MADITSLSKVIGMYDTKANIEAFDAGLKEQMIAYALDTEEFGIYANNSWIWLSSAVRQYRQFVWVIESGVFEFVYDEDGEPVLSLEDTE